MRNDDKAALDQQIKEARAKERRYANQLRILKHQQIELDRKKRSHRIFTRGAMLEKFLRQPLMLSNDQVYRLLQIAFNSENVQKAEADLIADALQIGTTKYDEL